MTRRLSCRFIQFAAMLMIGGILGCQVASRSIPDRSDVLLSALDGSLVVECFDLTEVCMLDLSEGGQIRTVTVDCAGECYYPSASPNGDLIVFVQRSSAESSSLWYMDANGLGSWLLVQDEKLLLSPAWSPNGALIAFRVLTDPYMPPGGDLLVFQYASLYTVAPDGTRRERLTPSDGYVLTFDWAPDGSQLIISARLEDSNMDEVINQYDRARLYTVDPVRQEIRPVAIGAEPQLSMHEPSWSPNGDFIAYIEGLGDSEVYGDLVIFDITNGSEEARLELSAEAAYSWSPDGEEIAFVGNSESAGYVDMFVFNLVTQSAIRLTDTSIYSTHRSYEFNGISLDDPVWSPDGRHLAFVWRTLGDSYIVVSSINGSDLSQVADPGQYHLFSWIE